MRDTGTILIPSPWCKPGPMVTVDPGFRRDDRKKGWFHRVVSRCRASSPNTHSFSTSTCGLEARAGTSPPFSFASHNRGPP